MKYSIFQFDKWQGKSINVWTCRQKHLPSTSLPSFRAMCHQVEFSSVLNLHEIGLSCSPSAVSPPPRLPPPYITYRSKETRVACHNNSEGTSISIILGPSVNTYSPPIHDFVSTQDQWCFCNMRCSGRAKEPHCLVQAFLRNEMEWN